MIGFEEAIEMVDNVGWYLNQLIDNGDEDSISILQGLAKVRDTFYDCRNELCGICGAYKNEYREGVCDNCRWG